MKGEPPNEMLGARSAVATTMLDGLEVPIFDDLFSFGDDAMPQLFRPSPEQAHVQPQENPGWRCLNAAHLMRPCSR